MSLVGSLVALKLPSVRFVLVGFVNTFFGLLVIYACKWFYLMDDVSANIVGYSCGLILSFFLNSYWTFSYSGRMFKAFLRFMIVIVMAYLVNLAVVISAIESLEINSYIAQALGIVPYTLITYFLLKNVVFRERTMLSGHDA